MDRPLFFAAPGNDEIARRLSDATGGEIGLARMRRFPDGESYVRIDTRPAGRDVAVVCTLDRPDGKVVPALFLAEAARELGAERVGLVAPYLPYLRQDRRFRDGEGLTSRYFARLLSGAFDWLVAVDPHLHRYASLAEIYSIPTTAVHVAPAIGAWVAANVREPLIVGPDVESEQWAAAVGTAAGAPVVLLEKTRYSDMEVEVTVPEAAAHRGRTPVLVDDIISTAQTMIATIRHLTDVGLRGAVCAAVHGVFAGEAYDGLLSAGAERVITCNTIPHPSNAVDVVPLIATSVADRLGGARPSVLRTHIGA